MVLCKHFQYGQCRFGAKCFKDHCDIKNTLQSDAESALIGKQWPFSCYGPFKDKKCLPNHIDDQSFEEIRYFYYEAKENNTLQQLNAQFLAQAAETVNKMQRLCDPPRNVIEEAMQIYDMVDTEPNANAKNPFATTNTNSNIFGQINNNGNDNGNGNGSFSTASNASGFFSESNSFGNAGWPSGSVQQTQFSQQPTIFGQQASPQAAFLNQSNNTNVFTQPTVVPSSFFGSTQSNQNQPMSGQMNGTTNSFFGQTQTTSQANGNFQSMMEAQQTPNTQAPTTFPVTGFFQQPAVTDLKEAANLQTPTTGFFQQPAVTDLKEAPNQQTPTTGFFAQQQITNSTQSQPNQASEIAPSAASGNADISAFSRMEDLKPDELEAFKAAEFVPCLIPFSPPPLELVL